jgi:hypothetical protein
LLELAAVETMVVAEVVLVEQEELTQYLFVEIQL